MTQGTQTHRGFTVDNVLHSSTHGDIHFHLSVPDGYDASRPHTLFVTLPGWQGLYFQEGYSADGGAGRRGSGVAVREIVG